MTLKQELREVLRELYDEGYGDGTRLSPLNPQRDIDQVLAQILTKIKERLPKEKQGIKHKEFPMDNGSHYSPTDNQKIGYNQCLTDTLKMIESEDLK